MIILDTNILYTGPDNVTTDLLRTIGTSEVERVGLPAVALAELVAHKVVPFRKRYEKAASAWEGVAEDTPWHIPQHLPPVDLTRLDEHWRRRFGEVAETIVGSEDVLHEALVREANLLPPCKLVGEGEGRKGHKVGARDAAIWLTAVEYARRHPEETVYFVSSNTDDFGDGTSYPFPMDKDIEGLVSRDSVSII
ncbi:PIN domain-containing protein [Streptomyces microflavus]|uniref:PIN domain-containing protein n=1 Tax=Streptomyces microflavus TaxID=1919 RepID=UPI00380AF003